MVSDSHYNITLIIYKSPTKMCTLVIKQQENQQHFKSDNKIHAKQKYKIQIK